MYTPNNLLKNISVNNPHNTPTNKPSFLPRINPNDEVIINKRLGAIEAIEMALKTVVCNIKQIITNNVIIILRFNSFVQLS